MEKKFNEEAYRNGSEVVCDVCGSVIEHINVKTRVIARQAEGFNVTEQYFTCQECGKKYTVLIVDHEMQFLIQKRQQVERQIKLHRQIRSRAQTIQRLIMKDEKIKKQQEERMIMLKEQYHQSDTPSSSPPCPVLICDHYSMPLPAAQPPVRPSAFLSEREVL